MAHTESWEKFSRQEFEAAIADGGGERWRDELQRHVEESLQSGMRDLFVEVTERLDALGHHFDEVIPHEQSGLVAPPAEDLVPALALHVDWVVTAAFSPESAPQG